MCILGALGDGIMRTTKPSRIIIAIVAVAPALYAQTSPPREPVARIGDQVNYDDDLLPSIGGQLWQIKNQEYDLKSKALVNVVNQRLLKRRRKARGFPPMHFWSRPWTGMCLLRARLKLRRFISH